MIVVEDIQNIILMFFKNKHDYKESILKKDKLKKRKFLTFLLIMCSDMNINELCFLTVDQFNKLKNGESICLIPFDYYGSDDYYDPDNYVSLDKKHLSLFIPELYNDFTKFKNDNDTLLDSIINKKALRKHNLRKDFNEIFTELILNYNIQSRLNT